MQRACVHDSVLYGPRCDWGENDCSAARSRKRQHARRCASRVACCALQLLNCALHAAFCALRIAIFAHLTLDATRLCTRSKYLLYKCTRNAREARRRRNDDAFIIDRAMSDVASEASDFINYLNEEEEGGLAPQGAPHSGEAAGKVGGGVGVGWGWRRTSEAGGRRQQRGKEGRGGRREGEEGRRGGERGRGVGTAIAPHNSEAAGREEVTKVANFSIEEPVALHIAFQVVLVTMLRRTSRTSHRISSSAFDHAAV